MKEREHNHACLYLRIYLSQGLFISRVYEHNTCINLSALGLYKDIELYTIGLTKILHTSRLIAETLHWRYGKKRSPLPPPPHHSLGLKMNTRS